MDSQFLGVLVAAITSIIVTPLIQIFQTRREKQLKLTTIQDEISAELIRQRITPYKEFFKQLEGASSLYQYNTITQPERMEKYFEIFQDATYGDVGLLASYETREILVAARQGCKLYSKGELSYSELQKRLWAVHVSLKSDLGISQPNRLSEVERLRNRQVAADSRDVDKIIHTTPHIYYNQGNNGSKISTVIFDMDGLMLDTERVSRDAWRLAMAERDYQISDDLYLQVIGRNIQDAKTIFCNALGKNIPIDDIYKRKQFYADEIINKNGVPIKPGLVKLLDDLSEANLHLAVASSTERRIVEHKLKLANLLDKFDVVVCGDDVENGKPAPDIFLGAANRLNIAPNECIVIEDSESGIKAAHAAKMLPIMIPELV